MSYTQNLNSAICQSYLHKTGGQKAKKPQSTTVSNEKTISGPALNHGPLNHVS